MWWSLDWLWREAVGCPQDTMHYVRTTTVAGLPRLGRVPPGREVVM